MNNNAPISPEAAPKIVMVICGGLISGCLLFLVVMLFLAKMQESWTAAGPITLIVVGLGVSSIALAAVLPGLLARSMISRSRDLARDQKQKPDEGALLRIATSAAMNQCIIRYALLEGAAFFAIISLMVEGSWLALGVTLFLLAAMLAFFPLPGRFESMRDELIGQMKS